MKREVSEQVVRRFAAHRDTRFQACSWQQGLTKRWSGRVVDKVPGVMRYLSFTRRAGAIVCTAAAQRPR